MSDEEHKCHCAHVTVIVHDFKRINWAIGLVFALVVAWVTHEAISMMSQHIRDDVGPGRSGERLAPDRIEEPGR